MCMFHKWSKWEQYTEKMTYWERRSDKNFNYENICQKRRCEKCNKVQHKTVKEGIK
jgi:hypothetical protein